jgi:hypothetical protein
MRRLLGLTLALGFGLVVAAPCEAQYWNRGPYLGGAYYQAPTYAYRYSTYPGLAGMGLYSQGMPGYSYGNTYGTSSFAQPGSLGYTTYAPPTTRTYSAAYNGYVAPGTGTTSYASPWAGTSYYYPYTTSYSYPRYDYSAFGGWNPGYARGSAYGYRGYGWGGRGGWYR